LRRRAAGRTSVPSALPWHIAPFAVHGIEGARPHAPSEILFMFPLYDDNPTTRRPYVTIGLIVACTLVYLWQISLDPRSAQAAVYSLGFIPAVIFGQAQLPDQLAVVPAGATILTSMFLHGSLMHLVGNLLYLWIFGNNIEDACGHVRFLAFYILCGTIAAFAQALPDPASEIPMIGASGAISGVLGAYLVLFPHARVHVLIPFGFLFIHPLKAGWVLAFWFVFQLVSGVMADPAEGGVAFWAHVGGFVGGMALIWVFRDRNFIARARSRGRSRIPQSYGRRPGPWG
jgi:membrane associated rhomboid family serine protease